MGRRRSQRPVPRGGRRAYESSRGPADVHAEKQRNDGHDTRLSGHDATLTGHGSRLDEKDVVDAAHLSRLNNKDSVDQTHDTRLDSYQTPIATLGSRMDTETGRNDNQAASIVNHADRIVALESFKNRAVGFAAAEHEHDTIYYRKTYMDTNFATRPHGAGQHL